MTETIEAPAAVKPINHWIAGSPYAGQSGRSGAVYNPATGQQTGAVDFASVEEVDRAVQAAKAAFPAWRATSLAKRAELFFPSASSFTRTADIAKRLTREHGEGPGRDGRGDAGSGDRVLLRAAAPLKSGMSEQASTGIDVRRQRRSGVVAGITPFNFPAMVDVDVSARSRAAARSC
jgi:malonate-semialdehyde dehydrogenase (acetylating)/methylmalonate-semialdehyde dehydrogenase